MCYRRNVCPMYRANGLCGGCGNCEHLKKAQWKIRNARIALMIAIIMFIITTAILGHAYSL